MRSGQAVLGTHMSMSHTFKLCKVTPQTQPASKSRYTHTNRLRCCATAAFANFAAHCVTDLGFRSDLTITPALAGVTSVISRASNDQPARGRHDMRNPTSSSSTFHLSATKLRGASRILQYRPDLHPQSQSRQHRLCSATSAHCCSCIYSSMSHASVSHDMVSALQGAGQEHLLAGWDSLTPGQRASLTSDIQVGNLSQCT